MVLRPATLTKALRIWHGADPLRTANRGNCRYPPRCTWQQTRQRVGVIGQTTAGGSGNRPLAVKCRLNEIDFLGLKERGMIALHKEGKLRYVGATREGMAVYENPENEKQCLHSRLHPESAKQVSVLGHPEVLLIPSKAQNNRGRQAKLVLRSLPAHAIGYIRSNVPAHIREREASTCWLCGELGHPAADCGTFRVFRSGDRTVGHRHSRRFMPNMLSTR